MRLIIDVDKDYYEQIKYNVEHGQEYKPFEIIANGIPYEERPTGEWYDCIPNCLKARHGEYVVYKIDYLLNNLAREVYLLKGTRMKGGNDRG